MRSQFTFRKEIVDDCKMILDGCFDNPIALHIRRGDYLINSGNHTNLGLDYYEKALSKFDSDRQVVVFSDDADWCMEQELFQDDRFIVSTGNGPYHDLYLMSQCSDFIIANSSFLGGVLGCLLTKIRQYVLQILKSGLDQTTLI